MLGTAYQSASARTGQSLDVKFEEFTLQNGLRVVVLPNHRAPVVTHSIWYRAGSAVEKKGKTGLAHFLEHLMFKGTKKYPAGAFDRLLKQNGGVHNAFTSADYTAYYQRIASDKLELVMDLESDRMKNLVLDDAAVLPERDVVKNERLQRIENDPTGPFWEQMRATLHPGHPYGRPVIGEMKDVEGLTREDALSFYDEHYHPRNAVLVVSGDATVERVRELATKYFGPIGNAAEAMAQPSLHSAAASEAKRTELVDPRVRTPMISKSYRVPSAAGKDGREGLALSFFCNIIGAGLESRLFTELGTAQGLVAETGASVQLNVLGEAQLSIHAVPNPGVGVAKLEAALDKEIERILKDGVTQDELDREVRRAYANLVYSLDDRESFAREIGVALMIGQTPKEFFDTSAWRTFTVAEVMAAARKHIAPSRAVTGILMRSEQDREGVQQ